MPLQDASNAAPKRPQAKRAPKTGQIARTKALVARATIELLAEVGYRSLTMEIISTRSGVARSTIYRHWRGVPELTAMAFETALGPPPPVSDNGDIRADLIAMYKDLAKHLELSIWGRTLPSLIEASANDSTFRALLTETAKKYRAPSKKLIENAKKRGELKSDVNANWLLDSITGPLYFRLLITRRSLNSPGFVSWLISNALSDAMADS